MIGKTVLGYQIDEKIGSGGFGTVYKVSKTNAAGTYTRALKHITLPTKKQYASILNSMGGDYAKADNYFASILKDIVGEINILSTLSESGTQNIVRYYENDIIETESPKEYNIYILMEYLTPFPTYLESTPFTVCDVIRLGKDILKALMACHEKNIIHRDIKDDNIFVSADGVFKLGDFGVSKALKDKSRAESVKGTPNFIAPEVYLGKEKYDNTVDVYSLGIVLYKLLNKSRNPFLPEFPAPYSSADEDAAFEARMSGKTPSLPIAAKNELGEAIVKATTAREQRFNSAEEFYAALENAEKAIGEEELAKELGLMLPEELKTQKTAESVPMTQTLGGESKNNNETVGGDILINKNETVGADADRHLFDTMAAPPITDVPSEPTPAPTTQRTSAPTQPSTVNTGWQPTYEPSAPPQVAAIEKKDLNWLIYAAPFIIAAIYIIVYLIIIPRVYESGVSSIEWLFENPEEIVDSIKDPYTFLNPIYSIIGFKIFNWVLIGAFIASLFFVGHTIQNKKPEVSSNAMLVGKDAYVMALSIHEEIKLITENDVTAARKAIYSVCERLKNESAFGSGSAAVINCENEIAAYLQAIQSNLAGLRDASTAAEATKCIESLCQRCLAKLRVRIELKKR